MFIYLLLHFIYLMLFGIGFFVLTDYRIFI